MSPKTLIAAALLAAGTMTALPAAAQDEQQTQQARPLPLRVQILFNLVDVNGDGAIDQTEIAALQRAIFVAIDADGDGRITVEEFRTVAGDRRARMARFGQWMDHHGGRQGPGFHRGGPRGGDGPGFHRGPRDGRQGQIEMPGAPDGAMPAPQLGEGEPGLSDGFPAAPRDFASLDTDGDGVISAEEFAAGAPLLPVFPQQ